MAVAGRILIIPKGEYNASITYTNLDLVFWKGNSWLAKKTAVGIEPSDANSQYWFKMTDSAIANNLTTEQAGYALDARQGKALKDEIDKLDEDLNDVMSNLSPVSVAVAASKPLTLNEPEEVTVDLTEYGFDKVPTAFLNSTYLCSAYVTAISKTSMTVKLYNCWKDGQTVSARYILLQL